MDSHNLLPVLRAPRVVVAVKDQRRAPFIYQTIEALALIRAATDGKERTTAIAVYVAFTEVANAQRRREGTFTATRRAIAEHAGVTKPTLDKYAEMFAGLGLLEVERRRDGDQNRPNAWTLLEPEVEQGGGQASFPGVAKPVDGGGQANLPVTTQEELQEEQRADVLEVWEHYVAVARPRVTKLQESNERKIAQFLDKGFYVNDMKLAVDGLLADDWHRQRGLTGISYLWKSGPGQPSAVDVLQRFINQGLAGSPSKQPGTGPSDADLPSWAREDLRAYYRDADPSASRRQKFETAKKKSQVSGWEPVWDSENNRLGFVAKPDQGEG